MMRVYDTKKFWTAVWKKKDYPCRIAGFIKKYDLFEAIGSTVLIMGCGHKPSSDELIREHRILLIDISEGIRELKISPNVTTIECDLVLFAAQRPSPYAEALAAAGGSLDTIIASNIINYLPWQDVFRNVNRDLKNGGLFFLEYEIDRGYAAAFHRNRPLNYNSVIAFFEDTVRHKILEINKRERESLILVSKKKQQ
jgi:SAM-dependent methyltransferase